MSAGRVTAPAGRLKRLDELTLADLEAARLVLRGHSVIDWHRLNFTDADEAATFLRVHELDPDDPRHAQRLADLKRAAIGYLRRQFEYPIPRPVEEASVVDLLMLAGGKGHRQTCACTILKCMHIIHHLNGRELLFVLPLSDQEVFHLVEEKVYRVVGGMLAGGFPIVEFVGGRKNKDSLYTKLLSKRETIAAQIYDKLRFRIVTRSRDDLLPLIQYLSCHLFPFNYVVPGQSTNSILPFDDVCASHPTLRELLPHLQSEPNDGSLPEARPQESAGLTPNDNAFSASNYRVIHFVVDVPVRLPQKFLREVPSGADHLGDVAFVICEFQLVDQGTDSENEQGDASHEMYKVRQKRAVMRRLHLGARQMRTPGSGPPPPPDVPQRPTPIYGIPADDDDPISEVSESESGLVTGPIGAKRPKR